MDIQFGVPTLTQFFYIFLFMFAADQAAGALRVFIYGKRKVEAKKGN